VAEALEIQEIREEFLREAGFNLTNLRNQVQLTYWSEQHFITQSLIELLPFGEILSDIRFYSYVDYSLDELVCYDPVLPPFLFLLPYFFSSHVTLSVTLPSHMTYVTWSIT